MEDRYRLNPFAGWYADYWRTLPSDKVLPRLVSLPLQMIIGAVIIMFLGHYFLPPGPIGELALPLFLASTFTNMVLSCYGYKKSKQSPQRK